MKTLMFTPLSALPTSSPVQSYSRQKQRTYPTAPLLTCVSCDPASRISVPRAAPQLPPPPPALQQPPVPLPPVLRPLTGSTLHKRKAEARAVLQKALEGFPGGSRVKLEALTMAHEAVHAGAGGRRHLPRGPGHTSLQILQTHYTSPTSGLSRATSLPNVPPPPTPPPRTTPPPRSPLPPGRLHGRPSLDPASALPLDVSQCPNAVTHIIISLNNSLCSTKIN